MPERIQLSRRKGWRMPPNTVKVDRSTRWGNPFNWKDIPATEPIDDDVCRFSDQQRRAWAAGDFRAAIKLDIGRPSTYPSNAEIRQHLAGKNLACWCPLDAPCHADVLLELANQEPHHAE